MPSRLIPALLAACAVATAAAALPIQRGNDFYVVGIDASRNGAYAVGTGPSHPVTLLEGEQSNVLSGGHFMAVGVSFNSIRSYSSGNDYFFGLPRFVYADDPGFTCVPANTTGAPIIEPISIDGREVGVLARWAINTGTDHLQVEERLVAHGDVFTESAVEVTLAITNLGVAEAQIGARYVWAWELGNRGGAGSPTIAPRPPEQPMEPYSRFEMAFDRPAFRSYVVSLEETPSTPGSVDDNAYTIEGTVGGIPLDPAPTPPDRLLHTHFGNELSASLSELDGAFNSCFSSAIADPPRIAFNGPNTGAVYLWGDTPDTARRISPGETLAFTQYVFAYVDFPLTCDAGATQTIECAGGSTPAELSASASDNVTGEGVRYFWTTSDPAVSIADPTAEETTIDVSGLGAHAVDLLVHQGGFATGCATQVEVVDTTSPTVARARAVPPSLWPPDHRLVPVDVELALQDLCDGALDIRLVDVTSDEPGNVRRGGDGHTQDDIQAAELGTADFAVLLRAERQGGRAGRTYTLVYEVADASGNVTTVPIVVTVSHDQRPSRRR
jgi:hypothetical protein